MSGASGMPLPGADLPKGGKKPLNLVAVNDRTWSTDADLEGAGREHSAKATATWAAFLALSYRSVGVVYGDLGTSPLYLWPSVFSSSPSEEDVVGALSLVLWTLTLIVVVKYVCIVLNANDHGEGGTFAIYSLLCRYAKINPIGAVEASDRTLRRYSTSQRRLMSMAKGMKCGDRISLALERHAWLRTCLLMLVLLGTCALVGDGILTPAISVVSAVSGLQVPASLLDDSGLPKVTNGAVVGISCAIMVLIFGGQRFGTSKIGFAYAPILFLWFLSNSAVGLFNIATSYPQIFKAISPHYIFTYFVRNGLSGWESLGGIVLAITDMHPPWSSSDMLIVVITCPSCLARSVLSAARAEALFADLGHFSKGTIRLSALGVVYPSLLLIYLGQGAYLVANPASYSSLFYSAQPTPVYWPMFVISILASIVASQSIVTGTFSIISQSMTLNCFPRVRIVHTSAKVKGQIYIPEINWVLLVIGIALILGFTLTQPASSPVNTAQLGNAFGVAVLSVMLVTTVLVSLVMLVVWDKPLALVLPFFLFFFIFEGVYFTANIRKVPTGAWFPLALAAIVMAISSTWHWASIKRMRYHKEHAMQLPSLLQPVYNKSEDNDNGKGGGSDPSGYRVLSTGVTVFRQQGVALYYSDSLRGLPPIFEQLLCTAPVLHKLIIFLHIRQVPVPAVAEDERLLVKPLELPGFFRVVARYGYQDLVDQGPAFVRLLMARLQLEQRFAVASLAAGTTVRPLQSQALSNALSDPSLTADDLSKIVTNGRSFRLPNGTEYQVDNSGSAKKLPSPTEAPPALPSIKEQKQAALEKMDAALRQLQEIEEAAREAIVYIRGRATVHAKPGTNLFSKLLLEKGYGFLAMVSRSPIAAFRIPANRLLEVGLQYEV